MRRLLGIFAAALLLSGTAQARIGETEAEIRARYGDPIGVLPSRAEAGLTKCYFSGGFSIAVTYIAGHSAREMVAKADKAKITDKEIHRLLEANAGGSAWNVQPLAGQKNVPAGLLEWRTNNQRSRVAFYDSGTQAFFVTTQHFIDLTNATNRQVAAKTNRGGRLARREAESLLRSFQNDSVAGALGGRQAAPSPNPTGK